MKGCELFSLIRPLQPLKRDLVMVWCVPQVQAGPSICCRAHTASAQVPPRFPVNLLFVAMIGTSFYALKAVGVGMVRATRTARRAVL